MWNSQGQMYSKEEHLVSMFMVGFVGQVVSCLVDPLFLYRCIYKLYTHMYVHV